MIFFFFLPQTNIFKMCPYLVWAFPKESDVWGTQDKNNLFAIELEGLQFSFKPLHTQGGQERKEDYSFTLWS